jgi:hypothetical protein
LNKGDIITHTGVVTEAYADMSISVLVPAINEQPIDQVRPEFISPLRWRPREDDSVVIYQRLGALRPDLELTWVGWSYDDGSTHLVPPWLDAGQVVLMGPDGRTLIVLDDDEHPAGNPNDPAGLIRFGRRDADEPVVLGDVYKASLERRIDLLTDYIDELWTWMQAIATIINPLFAPATPLDAPNAAFKLAVVDSVVLGTAVREQLVGVTVPPGLDVKTLIPDHLSDYLFGSKEPDPDPYTGEEG